MTQKHPLIPDDVDAELTPKTRKFVHDLIDHYERRIAELLNYANSRNPVSYHELAYEQATGAEPSYAPIDGKWPAPSRDEAKTLYEESERV